MQHVEFGVDLLLRGEEHPSGALTDLDDVVAPQSLSNALKKMLRASAAVHGVSCHGADEVLRAEGPEFVREPLGLFLRNRLKWNARRKTRCIL